MSYCSFFTWMAPGGANRIDAIHSRTHACFQIGQRIDVGSIQLIWNAMKFVGEFGLLGKIGISAWFRYSQLMTYAVVSIPAISKGDATSDISSMDNSPRYTNRLMQDGFLFLLIFILLSPAAAAAVVDAADLIAVMGHPLLGSSTIVMVVAVVVAVTSSCSPSLADVVVVVACVATAFASAFAFASATSRICLRFCRSLGKLFGAHVTVPNSKSVVHACWRNILCRGRWYPNTFSRGFDSIRFVTSFPVH